MLDLLVAKSLANSSIALVSDISEIIPLNKPNQYHPCDSNCPSSCLINFNLNNQTQVEICRLAGLPDIDQDNPGVRKFLKQWIQDVVSYFLSATLQ